MRKTQSHAIVQALESAGITHVFGIPGTHNIEVYDALADSPSITTVLITDEQSAGFMADGFARASGGLAALCLVPGAGMSHALSGIAEAYLDQIPLLVVACGVRRDIPKKFQLHDIDQLAMVRPLCKWAGSVTELRKLPEAFAAAARLAKQGPAGPVVLEVPAEYLLLAHPAERGIPMELPSVQPTPTLGEGQWRRLLELIRDSRQIGLYVGNIGGTLECQAKLVKLADRLNAWVWSTLSAKGLFPENHDRFLWNVAGAASPPPIQNLESQVDLWIMLGGRFGEVSTASFGFKPQGKIVHIDLSVDSLQTNIQEDLPIQADAWAVIDRLLEERIKSGSESSIDLSRVVRTAVDTKMQEESPAFQAGKIPPRELFKALQELLPADTAYSVDSGNGMFLAMENLRLTQPRCFLAPTDFSCMGYSVPAAVGARFADPGRTVVALPGDGAFLMTGLELLTGIRYGVAPIVIILRDGKLSQISQFQKRSLGREMATDLPDFKVEKIAEAVGARHLRISEIGSLRENLRSLIESNKNGMPVLAEVMIDYDKPTFFTRGIVNTNFARMPLEDKLGLAGRLYGRKLKSWLSPAT